MGRNSELGRRSYGLREAVAISLLALGLGGCATMNAPSSVAGSCQVFSDPGFRVRGLTSRDERWIARTQETGIQVCHWKRPARAPYKVDCATVRQIVAAFGNVEQAEAYARSQGASSAQIVQARACVQQPAPIATAVVAPKPTLWQRVRARFRR